jgi:hypothetical protein
MRILSDIEQLFGNKGGVDYLNGVIREVIDSAVEL